MDAEGSEEKSFGKKKSTPKNTNRQWKGRKPPKKTVKNPQQSAKAEKSRQSARACRERKKLRYQYLEELVEQRERAVFALRAELEMLKNWCQEVDNGRIPDGLNEYLNIDATRQ